MQALDSPKRSNLDRPARPKLPKEPVEEAEDLIDIGQEKNSQLAMAET